MKISNQFIFKGTCEKVWELLMDADVLKNAIPGTQKLEQTGDDNYKGVMKVGVGPVNGIFSVNISIEDKNPPNSYTMVIDSKGNAGFVKGIAKIVLQNHENSHTRMTYDADLQIGGRIAIVGQRLLDTVAKSMTSKGLEALNTSLQERLDNQV